MGKSRIAPLAITKEVAQYLAPCMILGVPSHLEVLSPSGLNPFRKG